MADLDADFFIYSGDTIYADNPIDEEERMLEDGTVWKNVVTEAKAKVAETMAEFCGNYNYNLMDENVRAFNAMIPTIAQWDDYEATNNWYPDEINNVIWLTADVHYTATHYYNPEQAQFTDFNPFYEFVSGPLNAGTFGPNELDNTFGPQVLYVKTPEEGIFNLPPSAGMQFFGQVEIDGETEVMMVTLCDLEGEALFAQEIEPVLG